MPIIPQRIRKGIEWHLQNANCIKAQAFADAEALRLKAESSQPSETGIKGKGGHGDPTARAAMALAEAERILKQAPLWLEVVEETRAYYEESKRLGAFYRMYYGMGLSQGTIGQKLGVEKTTMYDWRTEIITHAAMLAAEKGLVRINGSD